MTLNVNDMATGNDPADCPGLDACPPAVSVRSRVEALVHRVDGLAEHVEALAEANRLNEQRLIAVQRGHEYLAQQMADQVLSVQAIRDDLKVNTEATIRLDERSRQNHELLQGVSDALAVGRVTVKGARWALSSPKTWAALVVVIAAGAAWVKGVAGDAWASVIELLPTLGSKR